MKKKKIGKKNYGSGKIMKTIIGIIGLAGFSILASADLDEKGFEAYNSGSLSGQQKWIVDRVEEGYWVAAPERVEVVKDADSSKQYVRFKAGYDGKDQSRINKAFPAVSSSKVVATLDFQPGGKTIGGWIYFSEKDVGCAIALHFGNGTVWVLEEGPEKAVQTDSKAPFAPDRMNHFELQLDFDTHKCELFLEQKSIGVFRMNSASTCLNQLVLYGGGSAFASLLGSVSVVSVDKFPKTKPAHK